MTKFIPAPGFEQDLENDASTQAILAERANESLVAARAIAAGFSRTGDYMASLHVDGTKLVSDDPGATFIEFGTSSTPPHATLRKAAEQVGGRITGLFEDA